MSLSPPPTRSMLDFALALQARCALESVAFPIPAEVLSKLERDPPPAQAVHRVAKLLGAQWIKADDAPQQPWMFEAVVEAVELSWQGLGLRERFDSGLMGPYGRALTHLQRGEVLTDLAQQVTALLVASPALEAPRQVVQPLLLALREGQQIDALRRLLPVLLARPLAEAPWLASAIASMALVARESGDLTVLQEVSAWLDRLLDPAHPGDWLNELPEHAWSGLATVATRTLRLDAMCSLLGRLLSPQLAETPGDAVAKLLHVLGIHLGGPDVLGWAEQAVARLPSHPGVRMSQLQALAACGAPPDLLDGVLEQLDAEHPSYPLCLRTLGELAFEAGKVPLALTCYRLQEAAGTLDEMSALRLRHLTVRDSGPAEADASPPDLPILSAFAGFEAGLRPLGELLLQPPAHASKLTPALIQQRCAAAEDHFARTLATQTLPPLKEILSTTTAMWLLANAGALELRYWQGTFPFDFGPAFGTLDPLRAAAQCDGVLNHLVRLCRHVFTAPQPLIGGAEEASVSDLLQLASWDCDAHIARGQPEAALADLAALRGRLGPLGAMALDLLVERCSLESGDLPGALAARQRLPQVAASEVIAMNPWERWAALEGGTPQLVAQDAAVPGRWDVVPPQGKVRSEQHQALATALSVLPCHGVLVRNSHLLIGQRGGIMQPHAWHRQMGSFPFPNRSVLNRGVLGATLLVPEAVETITEPLVVMTNMDATFHRNFYHWMVLTLARIHLLNERGLLAGRRLLLPVEMSGWMKSSLRDIGLSESQIRFYRVDEVLRLEDALVASPAEFASPTQVESLRCALWRAAGLDPDAPPTPTRLLYITRSGEFRRPFLEEKQVSQMAVELGFDCVAPETLPLLEQVRLFASARGIAGPPGAAFTNLMWAQKDTRVLTFFKEEINGPTFIDLSFLRGQKHRWLQGKTLPGFEYISVVTSPYTVDLALARRELRWVAEA